MSSVITECNHLLQWLFTKRVIDWRSTIEEMFTANDANRHINAGVKAARKIHGTPTAQPLGCVPFNMHTAVEECFDFILPSHVELVIETLKSHNKILVLGRGKGKMTLLMAAEYLLPNSAIAGLDTNYLVAVAKAAEADIEFLTNEVKRLSAEVEAKQATIHQLQAQVNINYRTTWT